MFSEQRQYQDSGSGDDSLNYSSRRRATTSGSRPNQARRTGKAPQSVNGIHRRRRRKMSW